jgi:hypothetical protein
MPLPAAPPHGPIEPLFPDVFLVRGSFPLGPLVSFPRNMLILREGRALTLVNSVRLTEAGERELAALGEVKHVVKLGFFHDRDDPYYRATFSPTFWAPAPADSSTRKLVDGEPGPVERARVFSFRAAALGEGALVVEQAEGNLLVTCDSVQNWVDTAGCSLLGGVATRALGLVGPAKIGPIWLKKMTGGKPAAMRPDFDRLLSLDFRHLMAGHGVLLRDDAKKALAASCDRALGSR